jgi:hypothetical protein
LKFSRAKRRRIAASAGEATEPTVFVEMAELSDDEEMQDAAEEAPVVSEREIPIDST